MSVLVLCGTREGRDIAQSLQSRGHDVLASFAQMPRAPVADGIRVRIGGFGGADGFRACLRREQVTCVVDATHPFARKIGARSAALCAGAGIAYCRVLRPAWTPEAGDTWHSIADESAAADVIPDGATVFVATGRGTLDHYANLRGRYLIVRQIDPPDMPFIFENGEYLMGKPPFSVFDERKLFEKRKVDWLIVRNAGGAASRSKLFAARALGLPVAMIARPDAPEAPCVQTVAQTLAWVRENDG